MVSRIALFISTLVAAFVLAIGISLATGSAAADTSQPAAPDSASVVDGTAPRVQIDTVYVPAPATPGTITVHRTVTTAGSGEGEDEHEGGDD